jgi:hypothetical protein
MLPGMDTPAPVFSQLMARIHQQQFKRFAERYHGERRKGGFSCWDQFLCVAFAQLAQRDSLRETVLCLNARPHLLYHLGVRGRVRRSTLADANERRDWRIFGDLGAWLLQRAQRLYADTSLGAVDWSGAAYALDASTVDLGLSVFPWARFRTAKAGLKLHALLNLRGNIPSFLAVTPARLHEVNVFDWIELEPGAFYVMDRGYLDYARLYRIEQARAFFVIRAKRNLDFIRHDSQVVAEPGVRSDQHGRLGGWQAARDYPDKLRRVHYFDAETAKHLWFLTNHFVPSPLTIAQLYKRRWQVELFFKWIKQHLGVKVFYGTSVNAVKTQLWLAIAVYALVAILKKELALPQTLHEITQVLSVSLFEKMPLHQLFAETSIREPNNSDRNQLMLNVF